MTKTKNPSTIKTLLKQGKDNGFVTQEDILIIFPKPEQHLNEVHDFYDQLIKSGIDVFENLSDEE